MASTTIPEKFLPVLSEKKALAHLATVMPDGTPQVTPVWFLYENGKFIVNTARGRIKDRNMKKNAAVALVDHRPGQPVRAHRGARQDRPSPPRKAPTRTSTRWPRSTSTRTSTRSGRPGEVRVIYEIEPTSVSAMG